MLGGYARAIAVIGSLLRELVAWLRDLGVKQRKVEKDAKVDAEIDKWAQRRD